jgi:hypothetical protein
VSMLPSINQHHYTKDIRISSLDNQANSQSRKSSISGQVIHQVSTPLQIP